MLVTGSGAGGRAVGGGGESAMGAVTGFAMPAESPNVFTSSIPLSRLPGVAVTVGNVFASLGRFERVFS